MKVLIAEDDFTSRAVLSGVLKKEGHEVMVTVNGAKAWEALQQPDAPLLIILDWMMPEMDGPEVVRRRQRLPGQAFRSR
jgi:CheY-like chemotaxis protein